MKNVIVVLFVGINFLACDLHSPNYKQKLKNETTVLNFTSETDDCGKENYKHKLEAEIVDMTPAQIIDEMAKEQIYHMPAFGDDYGNMLNEYIPKDKVKILPVLNEYMNGYDPNNPDCNDRSGARFVVASTMADDIDNSVVRLRGIKEGQLAIEALEHAVERMRKAGFDKNEHELNDRFNLSLLNLKGQKGANIRDELIMNTLQSRHKVQMTEGKLLEFSNFLTSLDPRYPRWSDVGDYGPPPVLAESKKYYEVYLEFKKFKTKN